MVGKIAKLGVRVNRVEKRRLETKVTEDIYRTAQWREARAISIAMHAYRCDGCGARPRRLFVDHIVELRDGGAPYEQSNLRPLCGSCHTTKTLAARNIRIGGSG